MRSKYKCPAAQAQASLDLFILNYLSSSQIKSLRLFLLVWKNQIELQISISDSVGSDSGLSDLFGYNDAMKNAFTAASNDILKYLKMETDTKNI